MVRAPRAVQREFFWGGRPRPHYRSQKPPNRIPEAERSNLKVLGQALLHLHLKTNGSNKDPAIKSNEEGPEERGGECEAVAERRREKNRGKERGGGDAQGRAALAFGSSSFIYG